MGRVVLERKTRTVTGKVKLPNGRCYGSGPRGEDDVWCENSYEASGYVRVATCGYEFYFQSDNGFGYGWRQGQAPYVSASVKYPHRIHIDYPPPDGSYIVVMDSAGVQAERGGEYIEGFFSLTGEAELCLYTSGNTEATYPDENYPTYGGARAVGEYPETNARLVWEWVEAPRNVTVGIGGKSVTVEAAYATITPYLSFYCECIDDSRRPDGAPIDVTLSYDGIPVETDGGTFWKRAYGGHDCSAGNAFSGSVEVGAGYVKVRNVGWLRCSVHEACSVAVSGTLYVPQYATFKADAMAFDQPYPGNPDWWILEKWDTDWSTGQIVKIPKYKKLTGQAVSQEIKRSKCLINSVGWYNKAINDLQQSDNWRSGCAWYPPGAPTQTWVCWEHFVDETGPFQAWIVPPNGENPKDWRVGIRGIEFPALTVRHHSSLSTAPPTWTKQGDDYGANFNPPQLWEGYRYALVDSDGTTININGKQWTLPTDKIIDLCCPDNNTAKVDTSNTRYPLDSMLLPAKEHPLYGVNVAKTGKSIGGKTNAITLQRMHSSKMHGLEAFADWLEWKPENYHPNDGGSSGDWYEYFYIQRCMIGDVDGRQSFEAFDVLKITNTAPNRLYQDDYYHQSCKAVGDQIKANPAYTVEVKGKLDDYHDPNSLGAYCMTQGYTINAGNWSKTFDISTDGSGGTIKAQPIFDSIDWSDLTGDVFSVLQSSGGTDKPLGLVMRKVFRSPAWGVAINGGNGKHAEPNSDPSAIVEAKNTDETNKRIQTTVDPGSARYQIGPTQTSPNKWGNVRLRVPTDPEYLTDWVGVGGVPRRYDRVAFAKGIDALKGAVSYDVAPYGRHYYACVDKDGNAVILKAPNATHTTWTEKATEIACSSLSLRIERGNKALRLALIYIDASGNVNLSYSKDDGESWSMPVSIASNGVVPAIVFSKQGTRYMYWISQESESSFSIKGQIRDALDNVIVDTFTAIASVDKTGLAADESYGAKGAHRITLVYMSGGTLTSAVSKNGKEFS